MQAEIQDIVKIGYLNGLFVLARSIGLIGHALDQKRLQQGLYRHPWDEVGNARAAIASVDILEAPFLSQMSLMASPLRPGYGACAGAVHQVRRAQRPQMPVLERYCRDSRTL